MAAPKLASPSDSLFRHSDSLGAPIGIALEAQGALGRLLCSQSLCADHRMPERPPGCARLCRFYLMTVWLVPFALFISLAANDQTLPGAPGALPGGASGSGAPLPRAWSSSHAVHAFHADRCPMLHHLENSA